MGLTAADVPFKEVFGDVMRLRFQNNLLLSKCNQENLQLNLILIIIYISIAIIRNRSHFRMRKHTCIFV